MAVSRSTDGGSGWDRYVLSGSSAGFTNALAIAPGAIDIIYAGGRVGSAGAVYRSTDGGLNWAATGSAPPDTVYGLAVDPRDADVVYAATAAGAYKSTDGGSVWDVLSAPSDLRAVALYPGHPDTVFVGGHSGVHISADGGQTWQEFNDGLAGNWVMCLGLAAGTHDELIAGTMTTSAWHCEFETGLRAGPSGRRATALGVRPNPASGRLVLSGRQLAGGRVRIRLWNAAGRFCWQGEAVATDRLPLDVRGLEAGVYQLEVLVGGQVIRSRVVLTH